MPETQLANKNASAEAIETALIRGDLKLLTVPQRLEYYNQVCDSLGLNPLTQPFGYHEFNNKVVLYAKKDATEQLRKLHSVSVTKLERDILDDLVIVTAYVSGAGNRTDVGTGAVSIGKLTGEAKANAIMKAETKAKRRATLSLCGLGILDETELDSIPELPQVTALETKALPEAVTAPSAVNSAPATEGRSVSEQSQAVLEPLPDTPANAFAGVQAQDTQSREDSHQVARDAVGMPPIADSNKPNELQFLAYKSRASNLRAELEKHGFKASQNLPSGKKLVKYFTVTAGVNELSDLTISQWDTIFSLLDNLVKTDGRKAVEVIEGVIK